MLQLTHDLGNKEQKEAKRFICHVSYVSLLFQSPVAITTDSQCDCY